MLWELARREPVLWEAERDARRAYTVTPTEANAGCRDMTQLQDDWDVFLEDTKTLCTDEFWNLFLPIHSIPRVHIDTILRAVKKTFVTGLE
jgi:hypothetical protein